jgi:hypothetical protein
MQGTILRSLSSLCKNVHTTFCDITDSLNFVRRFWSTSSHLHCRPLKIWYVYSNPVFPFCGTWNILWPALLSLTNNVVTPLEMIKTLVLVVTWTSWRLIAQRRWCVIAGVKVFLSFLWRKASCLFSLQIRSVHACAEIITPGIGKYCVINNAVFRVRLDCHRLRRFPGSVLRKNGVSTILNISKNSKFSSKDKECVSVLTVYDALQINSRDSNLEESEWHSLL